MDQIHRLRAVDLNLLVVLEALLAERHVTRAGKLLGLSQSATSNALDRLRTLFDDPLLERSHGTMHPTPFARELALHLEEALASVAKVVAPRATLATVVRTVRWSVVDYGLILLAPRLVARLRRSAPGIDLVATPWVGQEEALAQVEDGRSDFAVSTWAEGAGALRWQLAFSDRWVVAMRRDHPVRRRFSLDAWLRHPHLGVSGRGQNEGSLDATLASQGKTRRVAMVVPSFLAVPPLLAVSDMLALVPERLLATGTYPDIVTRPPPLPLPSLEVGVAWHPRRARDVPTMHVVESLLAVARS